MSTQTAEGLTEAVRALAEEVLAATPHFLVHVHVRGHRGTRVVEVYVDGDEDFGLDDVATVSRELGFLMDVEDVVDGAYKLEVSSPGADHPLTQPRQFMKNVGRPLRVTVGSEKIEGELTTATDDGIEVARAGKEPLRLPYADIEEAKVLLPW